MVKCKSRTPSNNKFKCECDRSYKYKQGLQKHQVDCEIYQSTQNNTTSNREACISAGSANNNTINTNNPIVTVNLIGQDTIDQLTDKVIESVLRSGKLNI